MDSQNKSYNPVNNSLIRRHERTIQVGANNVKLYYPGTSEDRYNDDGVSTTFQKRIVGAPPYGWESDLIVSIESLTNTQKIEDIYDLMPGGTYILYQQNGLKSNRMPAEIGIAEEVQGENLEKVVQIIELWLKKKSKSK